MTVRDLVSGICQEYNLTNYQVRSLPEKALLNLEANAASVENAEIAIEDVDRRLSNFQLDNLHISKFIDRKSIKAFCLCSVVANFVVSSVL